MEQRSALEHYNARSRLGWARTKSHGARGRVQRRVGKITDSFLFAFGARFFVGREF
jgi:hypothetical protein